MKVMVATTVYLHKMNLLKKYFSLMTKINEKNMNGIKIKKFFL